MRTIRRLGEDQFDPLQGVANLFDVGVVFALGFLVAFITYIGPTELVRNLPVSDSRAAGQPIDPNSQELEQYRFSTERARGEGVRLGAAYRLSSGEVVCVPDEPKYNATPQSP